MTAVSCPGDTYVVVKGTPCNLTTDVGKNVAPVTVIVNGADASRAADGDIADSVGVSAGTLTAATVVLLGSALEDAFM